MNIKGYVDNVFFKEFNLIKNELITNLVFLLEKHQLESIYITQNFYPIYVFSATDLLTLYSKNEFEITIEEFINRHPKKIDVLDVETNIIDAYYHMRANNFRKIAVIEDNKLIGEMTFKIISTRISDIVIRDKLTGLYNANYFSVLVEEYKDFDKPLGIIYIDVSNLAIVEGLYGKEKLNKILIAIGEKLESLVRDIDFVFRINYRFKIITFNSLEITEKIANRIKKALDEMEIDEIQVNYSLAFSNVPELEPNILLALEDLKRKIIN